jgi:hypothetical protein
MPAGRPTDYLPEYCEEVVGLGRAGKSLAQMCSHFDISRQTIDNWAKANPDFLEALSRAKAHAQAWWEETGVTGMSADKFNAVVWKKSVEARFREDYTERQEVSGPAGGPIKTDNRFEIVLIPPDKCDAG